MEYKEFLRRYEILMEVNAENFKSEHIGHLKYMWRKYKEKLIIKKKKDDDQKRPSRNSESIYKKNNK